jgi:hypothetical protein
MPLGVTRREEVRIKPLAVGHDPPTFATAVPGWRPGDTTPLGRRLQRVIDIRAGEDEAVLVVEERRLGKPREFC